jgi:AAA family ATP:ADP antiporter
MIVLFGQMGNIFGPMILNARFLGTANSAPIVGICAILMLLCGLMFWVFMAITPESELRGYEDVEHKAHEQEPGFFEGLKLLFTKPYLLGIFAIIMIYEIIVTVIDFHFKSTVAATFTAERDVNGYLSSYAYMTGIVATICILLGINSIQKRLGMRASLVFLPILVTFTVFFIKLNPQSINVAFWIMVCAKAVNYALNQPTLKQLYIPTTKDTKYKAQAWMEMFGGRGAKAGGSVINDFSGTYKAQYGMVEGVVRFLTFSSIISLGLIGVWVVAAVYIARVYEDAIRDNKVVC